VATHATGTHFTSPRWGEVGSECNELPGEGVWRFIEVVLPHPPLVLRTRVDLSPWER